MATQIRSEQTQFADGWIRANETWTYASATTITVPSGAVDRYQKGMPFKLTANSVELQGYIIGVADTLLTVAGDALTNHTFTDNYYAQSGTTPLGFKDWFDYTPSYSASGSMTYTSVTSLQSKFKISGLSCIVSVHANGTTGGTASTQIYISTPITANVPDFSVNSGSAVRDSDSGSNIAGFSQIRDSGANIAIGKYDASNFGLGTGRVVSCVFIYTI